MSRLILAPGVASHDVQEYSGTNNFPQTGESGKIYVDTSTNKTYRWNGSAYSEFSSVPSVTATDNGKVLRVANGEWSVSEIPAAVPSVTSTDNGKVLRVVNGAWAAAEIPAASGVSF
jgi:hypothetical protein